MGKIIKKIKKFFWLLLMVVTMFISILFGVLHIPRLQSAIIAQVSETFENKTGVRFTFEDSKLKPLNSIHFQHFLLNDLHGDTLIATENLNVTVKGILPTMLNKNSTKLFIKNVHVNNGYIRLFIDNNRNLNVVDLINALLPNDTTNENTPFDIKEIQVTNSKLKLFECGAVLKTHGINLSHIDMSNFNLRARKVIFYGDTVKMNIRNLSFKEQSGLEVRNMNCHLHLCKAFIHLSSLLVQTQYSEINSEKLSFYFDGFYQFSQGRFFDNVRTDWKFNNTIINTRDIGYFSDFFVDTYQVFELSTHAYGTMSNLKLRQLMVKFGQQSFLSGSVDFNGLPNKKDLFIIADFEPLYATMYDIKNLNLPGNKTIEMLNTFKDLTYLNYQGNFTGFLNDFVSYGTLQNDYGEITTDIILKPDTTNSISFMGEIQTNKFSIGKLLDKKQLLGHIDTDVTVVGNYSKKNGLNTIIKGLVPEIYINQYNYNNIVVDGKIKNKFFDGELTVKDKNLDLFFEGLVNFKDTIPQFNFILDVPYANLSKLNINKKDTVFNASFLMEMKGSGNNISNTNADIKLVNSLLSKADDQIQLYDLDLKIINDSLKNEIILTSNILDGFLRGNYHATNIPGYFKQTAGALFPSLQLSDSLNETNTLPALFDFNLHLKNIQPVISFFTKKIELADNTIIEGTYRNGFKKKVKVHFSTSLLRYNKNRGTGIVANIDAGQGWLSAELGCASLLISNRISLDNYTFTGNVKPDTIEFNNRWLNWDTIVHRGNISGMVLLSTQQVKKPKIELAINNFGFMVNDYAWSANPFSAIFDSSSIKVQNLKLEHQNEYIVVNGKISDNGHDSLDIRIDSFNLKQVNLFSKKEAANINGILNGKIILTGTRGAPLFTSDIIANNFNMNNQLLGNVSLTSVWDNTNENLLLDFKAMRDSLKTIEIIGDYKPKQQNSLNLNCNFDKLWLNVAAPYVDNIFTDLRGILSGSANITGNLKKPLISGRVNLQKTKFGIDYLKTTYNFSSHIDIINNNILINDLNLYDTDGNVATVNGSVYLKKFSEVFINMNIYAKQFNCLNTTLADNPKYYGKAYVDGSVKIGGSNSDLTIDVAATTAKGTVFNIPLIESGNASRYSYIKLIETDTTGQEEQQQFIVVEKNNNMALNFDLNVTPDANIQIVFDPQIGDIIKAWGNGQIEITAGSAADFNIVGEYIIERGDYLFTLQNLFNKKFKVNSGSSIRWTGDPLNANININAVYPTKASLYNLFGYTDDNFQTQSRTTVNCELGLTGNLLEPQVEYNITLPNAEPSVQDRVASKVSTEEKLSKQFLSLLVLNQFMLDESVVNSDTANSSNTAIMAGGANASELLSNQLSNWLSQISDEVDVGINYRPGTQVSSHEVELALSTQLLNDRLSINGSVDMKTNAEAENVNRVLGDIDVDYKIIPNGKVRLRAFNHSNNDEITEYSPYTQGVGIFYREDFDTFSDLWSRYLAFFSGEWRKKKNSGKEQ